MTNGKAVAVRDEALPAQSEAGAIVDMIASAARDPKVDPDKMKALLDMRERIIARENEAKYDTAMALAQAEMRPVARDCENPQTRSRYASYAALDGALRPIYGRLGFALSFDTADGAPIDHVRVVCLVSNSGHRRQHHIDMPADGKGAKGGDVMTRTHATGSAVTYGRRYLLQMIFNIVAGDDDGNAAAGPPVEKITEGQVGTLQKRINETGVDKAALLKWARVASLSDIRVEHYESVRDAIEHAARNKKR